MASGYTIVRDILYGRGTTTTGTVPLYMDAYLPVATVGKTPIQYIHGGGFTGGHRDADDIVELSKRLAAQGYAVFSISYRLQGDNPVIESISQAAADAIVATAGFPEMFNALIAAEDSKKARDFVASRRGYYGVDTVGRKWGMIGQSAGAIAALTETYGGNDYFGQTYRIGAIIDLWGAVPTGIIQAGEAPVLIVHGTADATIPYTNATDIQTRANLVGVPNELISMTGVAHGGEAADIFNRAYSGGGVIADRVISWMKKYNNA